MILFDLLVGFFKVGCFSFGGAYSAIPLIRDVVLSYGWLTDDELTYMIAVGESTPGSIMVNLATYIGSSQAGILGSMIATFAVALPSFLIILAVVTLLENILKNTYVGAVLGGLKPCVIGIVFAMGVYMTASHAILDIRSAILTILLLALTFGSKRFLKKKISPIMLIIIAAVMGILIY